MEFYGVDMKGRFINQKVSSLPSFDGSRDQGRFVYRTSDGTVWYGGLTEWERVVDTDTVTATSGDYLKHTGENEWTGTYGADPNFRMSNYKIEELQAGTVDTDAVNLGQLKSGNYAPDSSDHRHSYLYNSGKTSAVINTSSGDAEVTGDITISSTTPKISLVDTTGGDEDFSIDLVGGTYYLTPTNSYDVSNGYMTMDSDGRVAFGNRNPRYASDPVHQNDLVRKGYADVNITGDAPDGFFLFPGNVVLLVGQIAFSQYGDIQVVVYSTDITGWAATGYTITNYISYGASATPYSGGGAGSYTDLPPASTTVSSSSGVTPFDRHWVLFGVPVGHSIGDPVTMNVQWWAWAIYS